MHAALKLNWEPNRSEEIQTMEWMNSKKAGWTKRKSYFIRVWFGEKKTEQWETRNEQWDEEVTKKKSPHWAIHQEK